MDNKPQNFENDKGIDKPQAPGNISSFRDALPKDRQIYLRLINEGVFHRIRETLQIPDDSQQELENIVYAAEDEYFATGDITQETIDRLFEQAWALREQQVTGKDAWSSQLNRQSGRVTVTMVDRETAKTDFGATITGRLPMLRGMKQYIDKEMQKAAERAENLVAYEKAKTAWRELSETHWQMEKTKAKNPLTEDERIQVGRLLRGEIELKDLDPEREENIKGITAVYEATQAHEEVIKQLDRYEQGLKEKLRTDAGERLQNTGSWKGGKAGIFSAHKKIERDIRYVVNNEKTAEELIRHYIVPVREAEAEATRWKEEQRAKVRALEISQKVGKGNIVSEAYAVQLIGEAEENIKYLEKRKRGPGAMRDGKTAEQWKNTIAVLEMDNPNMNFGKVRKAVQRFRELYDEMLALMNRVRIENGYAPINHCEAYFPHFSETEADAVLVRFGRALGIDTEAPVRDGVSRFRRLRGAWVRNANVMLRFDAAYDAVQCFDKYIEGAAIIIFRIENIVKLRALAQQILYSASDEDVQKQMDAIWADRRLTEEEQQIGINALCGNGKCRLSNFVNALDEYTNRLANKKKKACRVKKSRNAYGTVGGNFGAGNTNANAKREPADDIKHRGPVFFCCALLLAALIFCSVRFNFAREMGYALNALMLLLATYCLLWRIPKRILLAIAKRNNTDPEAPWRKPGLSRRDQRRELQDYYFPGGTNPEFVIIALVVLMFVVCVAGDKNMRQVREEYEEKISIAYEDGYKEGESVGQEEGYIDGYDAAPFYDEGYNEGYDAGYRDGYRDGSKTK